MADDTFEISFRANPVQRAFIESEAKADLFAARMGEGKSAALCWACFHHTQRNPGARWAFIRDTWENLRDTTQKEFFEWFPVGICGEYLANAKTYRWRIGEMRGEIQWLGMDDPKDAAKLQSRALGAFAMDEPAPAAESGGISEFIFTTAMSRLRQKGMNNYAAKLAENNPDETHWTYKRFVDPGTRGMRMWQTREPENLENLPEDYYGDLETVYEGRPDLIDRFVRGLFGFQRKGRPVTPAWNDKMHLRPYIEPVPNVPLHIGWDFGLTPTMTVTQIVPSGHWNVLECLVGDDMDLITHIEQNCKPLLQQKYDGYEWDHTYDPAGGYRDQTTGARPISAIRKLLGGSTHAGPERIEDGVDPLNHVLSQMRNDRGLVQVDKRNAAPVYLALRGGWHYPVRSGNVIGDKPVKDEHSHPGDTMRYLAGRFFPIGQLRKRRQMSHQQQRPRYFEQSKIVRGYRGTLPKGAETIEAGDS
jgi:hypothetical protein